MKPFINGRNGQGLATVAGRTFYLLEGFLEGLDACGLKNMVGDESAFGVVGDVIHGRV